MSPFLSSRDKVFVDRAVPAPYNTPMKFELTPEMADQVIFGMENQDQEYLFDTREMKLIPLRDAEENPEDPERYLPLPAWQSVDGYNLMESFVAGLRNPVLRETLRNILASGRGVFRQFKNALKDRAEMERLWFNFKEREMRKEVVNWYNTLRESWGLSEVEIVFEETGDLILSDFLLERWVEPDDILVLEMDRRGFFELFPRATDEQKEGMYRSRRGDYRPSGSNSLVMRADTPAGEIAGFLWAIRNNWRTDLATLHVLQIYVLPEYRGLGLAKTLFRAFCEATANENYLSVTIELMGEAMNLNESFRNEGFVPFSEVLEMDLRSWRREPGD